MMEDQEELLQVAISADRANRVVARKVHEMRIADSGCAKIFVKGVHGKNTVSLS